jgi:DNA-binding YbaB/EbfC family protein
METKEFKATAGGGAVEVTVSGKKEVLKVTLSEEVVDPDDIEMLQDLIVAATNEAMRQVDDAIQARNDVARQYRQALRDVPGVRFFEDMPGVKHNYSYFPIFINAEEYGMTRDQLYFKMKEANVLGRRYFYPLISTFDPYRSLPSSSAENLPVATRMADEVICLPMHHEMSREDIDRVIEQIVE